MKKITKVLEGVQSSNFDSTAIMQRELAEYTKRMKGKLSKDLQVISILLSKYAITSKSEVEVIASLTKNELNDYIAGYNGNVEMDVSDLKTLIKLINKNTDKLRQLPMFQTEEERNALLAGKMAMSDLDMDLDSEIGRNAIVKQYMPLVIKIAKQFVGKSNLDFKELYSAGMLGLTLAMNSYRKPDELKNTVKNNSDLSDGFGKDAEKEQKKSTTFLTWASYMIRSYILEDIKNLSRTVRVPVSVQNTEYQANREKNGVGSITKSNSVSTDDLFAQSTSKKDNDGGRSILDMNPNLNTVPDEYLGGADSNRIWKKVFDIIGKNFKERDCRIFYRFLGLNGFEKMKNSEISKKEGISASNVTFIVKQIIEFLKNNKTTRSFLEEIYDRMVSNESIEYINDEPQEFKKNVKNIDVKQYGIDEEKIIEESKIMQLIIKAIAKFSGKKDFLEKILKYGMEGNFNKVDDNYDKYKEEIKSFLKDIYPKENWNKKTDVEIINKFIDVSELYDEFENNK